MNIICIEDLNFRYNDKIIFKNLNLTIKKNKITTIIGANGSGKSILASMLIGEIPTFDKIKYNDTILNKNSKKINKEILLVNNYKFSKISVLDEFLSICPKDELELELSKLNKYLDLSNIMNLNLDQLNDSSKTLVMIALTLLKKPKVIIIDSILENLDGDKKNKVFKLLLKISSNTTIINITYNIEDALIKSDIKILGNSTILLSGGREKIFRSEKLLNNIGFKLPFIIELCNRLKFYDLIDKNIYCMDKLVNTLWK